MKNIPQYGIRILSFFFVLTTFSLASCATRSESVETALSSWSNEALLATLNYSYANYTVQQQVASKYFMPRAWQAYNSAVQISGNLHTVIRQQMVASAQPQGPAILLNEGPTADGVYLWRFQVPLLLIYENDHIYKKQSVIATLSIINTTQANRSSFGVKGYALTQLLLQEVAPLGLGAPDNRVWNNKE